MDGQGFDYDSLDGMKIKSLIQRLNVKVSWWPMDFIVTA